MAHLTLALEVRGCEVEVDVEGDVLTGGSNRYGSDEPEWCEVQGVVYYNPRTGKRLSPRLTKLIESLHDTYVTDRLAETHNEW